jgi:hypothetical protein
LPPGRTAALAADTLEALGVGTDAEVLATLSVTLEAMLEPDALAERRAAVAALDVGLAAKRVADAVNGAWRMRDASDEVMRGLPQGLERLSTGRLSAPAKSHRELDDIEDRVERELRALKERLTDE